MKYVRTAIIAMLVVVTNHASASGWDANHEMKGVTAYTNVSSGQITVKIVNSNSYDVKVMLYIKSFQTEGGSCETSERIVRSIIANETQTFSVGGACKPDWSHGTGSKPEILRVKKEKEAAW